MHELSVSLIPPAYYPIFIRIFYNGVHLCMRLGSVAEFVRVLVSCTEGQGFNSRPSQAIMRIFVMQTCVN